MSNDANSHDFEAAPAALSIEEVDTILAAVQRGAGNRNHIPADLDRAALARDLGRTRLFYRLTEGDDRELTAKQKLKHLQDLRRGLEKLQERFHAFAEAGRPGWPLVEAAANERYQRVKVSFATVEAELVRLEEQSRVSPWGGGNQQRLKDLNELRHRYQREYIAFDASPIGILNQTINGVDALLRWMDIALEEFAKSTLLPRSLVSDRDEPGRVTALRWLLEGEIPQIYARHFGHKVSWSRSPPPDEAVGSGQPGGPALRFAQSVLALFGVTSLETGRPLTDEAIIAYWRHGRDRAKRDPD